MWRHVLAIVAMTGCQPAAKPADVGDTAGQDDDVPDTDLPDTDPPDRPDTDPPDTDPPDTDPPDTDPPHSDTSNVATDTAALCLGGAAPEIRLVDRTTPDVAAVVDGLDAFGWDLFHRASGTGNALIAPLSVSAALGMTMAGASGTTRAELEALLRVSVPADRFHAAWGALLHDLSGVGVQGASSVRVVDSLYGLVGVPWAPAFLDTCARDYQAPFIPADLRGDPEGSRQRINAEVLATTCGMIDDLLPIDSIAADSVLVVVNALYLEADWAREFDPNWTLPDVFHLANGGRVRTPFMVRDGQVRSSDVGAATVFQIPFRDDDLGLWVVLPKEIDGLPAIEATLDAPAFDAWAAAATATRVELYLPKVAQGQSVDLVPHLTAMGLASPWRLATADFSAMVTDATPLSISAVHHQTEVVFDEVGARAGAATAVVVSSDTASELDVIDVDRPFLFVIRDERSHAVMFIGRVTDPTP